MCLIHKWKKVYEQYEASFLGEKVIKKYPRFRICLKCGKMQEFQSSLSGSWTYTLNPTEKEILLQKIEDKGDYFILQHKETGRVD